MDMNPSSCGPMDPEPASSSCGPGAPCRVCANLPAVPGLSHARAYFTDDWVSKFASSFAPDRGPGRAWEVSEVRDHRIPRLSGLVWQRLSLHGSDCPTADECSEWVFHGTPLSIARSILNEGMRVGTGHHRHNSRTLNGNFFIQGIQLAECLIEARDRATVSRCRQWGQHGKVPSAWSCPVVIAFRFPAERLATLDHVGWVKKMCLQGEIGETQLDANNLFARSVHIYFRLEELMAYTQLHRITEIDIRGLERYMICGGHATWDNQAEKWIADPLAWATAKNHVPPSCGRHILMSQLSTATEHSSWIRSKKAFYFCAQCYNRRFD